VVLEPGEERWLPVDAELRAGGVNESRALDMQGPRGCSKGAADQYVLDYARSFGLRTVVFRTSDTYGPRQMGDEHDGWLAHIVRSALDDRPLVVHGDGRQVRDVLFVDDLVDAMIRATERIERIGGRAYNIGGGPANAISVRELLARMSRLRGRPLAVTFRQWRPGDRRYWVSDTRRFATVTGWWPRVGVDEGIERLVRWMLDRGHAVSDATPVTVSSQLQRPAPSSSATSSLAR
jgi:CDP-paratose 2-epimerase